MSQPTYLALSPLLHARLESLAAGSFKVLTSASLEEAERLSQKAPAVAALFAGAVPVSQTGEQSATADPVVRWESRWDVAAIVRTAKQHDQHASDMHTAAESILATVIPSLVGWAPGAGFGRLNVQAARSPIIRRAVAIFPVRFITTNSMRSEP